MVFFWKSVAGIIITLVLWICIQKQEKDIALLLSIASCILVIGIALKEMTPVLDLLRHLESIGNLENGILSVLLKAVSIGLVTELTGMLCSDAGNSALQKAIQFLGAVTMLTISVPIFQTLLALIQEIIGSI